MSTVHEFGDALLDLTGAIPRLFLSSNGFELRKLGDTQFPMKNCVYTLDGDVHTITGDIPQYKFVINSFGPRSFVKELSAEEADKFDSKYIKTGRHLWGWRQYKYLQSGWCELKERKEVEIVIHGGLVLLR